jgi:hypothetical protein
MHKHYITTYESSLSGKQKVLQLSLVSNYVIIMSKAIYPPSQQRATGAHWIESGLGIMEKRKIYYSHWDLNPRQLTNNLVAILTVLSQLLHSNQKH